MKKEFIVKKFVEYQYTIEADNEAQAERIAMHLEAQDADQWTIHDIATESIEDYQNSLKD
jgi:hypothetical protein